MADKLVGTWVTCKAHRLSDEHHHLSNGECLLTGFCVAAEEDRLLVWRPDVSLGHKTFAHPNLYDVPRACSRLASDEEITKARAARGVR